MRLYLFMSKTLCSSISSFKATLSGLMVSVVGSQIRTRGSCQAPRITGALVWHPDFARVPLATGIYRGKQGNTV